MAPIRREGSRAAEGRAHADRGERIRSILVVVKRKTLAPMRWLRAAWFAPRSVLFFRNIGAIGIAAVACVVPEVGPNRFWIAGILAFVCVPAATWLENRIPVAENGWVQPLFDLTVVVTLVHLIPDMWYPALVIGLIVVQAPSVAESEASARLYALFATILTAGMTFAAVVHDVPGWHLPILAMVVLYPSVIFYSHRQSMHANEIRERAQALEGLRVVAGGVAHDFNNLLTGVLGHAELALAELPHDAPARESIEEAMSGAERAGLLSARLLSFSGSHMAPRELLDTEAEVRDLIALLRPVVPKGVELELESTIRGVRVRAGRAELQQLVMNLILNASEACGGQPSHVRVRLEPGSSGAPRPSVRLRVVDEGPGIPKALQPRIFDPFFTLKERGHGLGLSSARAIVDDLGGRIQVESVPGEGTEMIVHLPAEVAAEAPLRAAAPPVVPLGGRALVVDDEAPVRSVLSSMLRQLDYDVEEAVDGFEGVRRFREAGGDFSAVLLDLRMPGMDGWQCLQELQRIRTGVPVVVCSGHDPFDVRDRPGGSDVVFLPKPVRLAELREALTRRQA